jgi:hypothetical protein
VEKGAVRTIKVFLATADYHYMPNLYFCQPHAKNQGMLRAVLSLNECKRLVNGHSATYLGEQFPHFSDTNASGADFALLRVVEGETNPDWRPGFYKLESDLNDINEALRMIAR